MSVCVFTLIRLFLLQVIGQEMPRVLMPILSSSSTVLGYGSAGTLLFERVSNYVGAYYCVCNGVTQRPGPNQSTSTEQRTAKGMSAFHSGHEHHSKRQLTQEATRVLI